MFKKSYPEMLIDYFEKKISFEEPKKIEEEMEIEEKHKEVSENNRPTLLNKHRKVHKENNSLMNE